MTVKIVSSMAIKVVCSWIDLYFPDSSWTMVWGLWPCGVQAMVSDLSCHIQIIVTYASWFAGAWLMVVEASLSIVY